MKIVADLPDSVVSFRYVDSESTPPAVDRRRSAKIIAVALLGIVVTLMGFA